MNSKRISIIGLVILSAISLTTLWLVALAPAQPVVASQPVQIEKYADKTFTKSATLASLSIIFPPGVPWFANDAIHVHPEPVIPGQPVEICAEIINTDPSQPQLAVLEFGVAPLGISLPYEYIGAVDVEVPPDGHAVGCIGWVPPEPGSWGIEVIIPGDPEPQRILRNMDVDEPLQPGVPHERFFLVHNPTEQVQSISLGLNPNTELHGWQFDLSQDNIPDLPPGADWEVSLIVTPPAGQPLPPDGTCIVDVEGSILDLSIGGFRKIFRPPVPLHRFPDPTYAEGEISVHPYPPQAGEPVEICVELYNFTPHPQEVEIQFSWADFGIGLPFTPINGPIVVEIPPHSVIRECIHWVPPIGGQLCLQVELFMADQHPQRSQRNLDVNEPLRPGEPHDLVFPVRNPLEEQATIVLGLIPHLPGWEISLSSDILPDMEAGETKVVTLTVQPPREDELPPDGHPVVDVEAFVGDELIGGFRKIFRPPVPLHIFPDPPYAEREISVHPYPPMAGQPTEVCVELRNPTPFPQDVNVQFSWANFGIGLPFTPINGLRLVHLPPFSIVRECIHWIPPVDGQVCLQVELFTDKYPVQWSRLNLDVDEPLEPEVSHARPFEVRNPFDHPVTVTLGVIPHLPEWGISLSEDLLLDMVPGEVREVTLTVKPTMELPPDEHPVVDIEAFGDGAFIGGFRKIYRPPVPIHRPKDPVYAESEIGVDPYPVLPGQPVELSVELFNPTDQDRIVTTTFMVANFGIGLPFSTDFIAPNPIRIFVPAYGAARGHVVWTPPEWEGKFCVRVELEMGGHDVIWSERNIDVGEPLEPGQPHSLDFPVGAWPFQKPVTVTLGTILHQGGWEASLSHPVLTNVAPGTPVTVTLTVTPSEDAELGNGEPIVDVEAFVDGELIGGFRKMNIPPFPLHKPHEKGYAESEIVIEPYPPKLGEETIVSTVIQNNGDVVKSVNLEFGWAKFGMGIPFTTTGMSPYASAVTVEPGMTETVTTNWIPSMSGHQCVIIKLTDPDEVYEPQESQRNIYIEDQPPCDHTQVFTFTVYNDSEYTATVDVGSITFNVPQDWKITVVPSPTLDLDPFSDEVVTVTVNIPCPSTYTEIFSQDTVQAIQAQAGSVPTIDVEGYNKGVLVGGIELQFPTALDTLWRYIFLPIIH